MRDSLLTGTFHQKQCQAADWPKHKKEPCRPFEELVEDDDLWDESGMRIGTTRFLFASR
jgi:hypothetical protein